MKRIVVLLGIVVVAFVVVLPQAVWGQVNSSVASRYCPDPSKIFKGSIYHTDDGAPWIEVATVPTNSVSANNLVVHIKPEFNYYCIPGLLNENGNGGTGRNIVVGDLPATLSIPAALVVGVKGEPVVDPMVFSRTSEKDEQGRFVYERKMKGRLDGVAQGNMLPKLGLHTDKLNHLRESISSAIDEFKKRKDAAGRDVKGGEVLTGDSLVDAPLYLLRKMQKELETNPDGSLKQSLKDSVGYNKLFVHLRALKKYADPSLDGVFQRADELTGFSFLFPPSPEKPSLVFIPGASGEATTYAGIALLREESKNFNIIGYTYNATLSSSEMIDTLVREFAKENLGSSEHVLLMMSMGNTVTHGAILSTLEDPEHEGLFANSHVVSVGFLPGGSAKFTSKWIPDFIPPMAAVVFPPYASIFKMMNPTNPLQSTIAHNIREINAATKGISYIQANKDPHVDLGSNDATYAPNRDLIFTEVKAKVTFITPPETFEKNNSHINMFDSSPSSEVRKQVESFLGILKKPKAFLPGTRASVLSAATEWFSAKVAFAEAPPRPFDPLVSLVGRAASVDEHASLVETLQDGLMVATADYADIAASVRAYLALSGSPWTFENLEKEAQTGLQKMGFSPGGYGFPSLINQLRARLKELIQQRDELRARRDKLRGVWSIPTAPTSPSPLLNAAPLREQLGNISTALQSILEAMQGAVR